MAKNNEISIEFESEYRVFGEGEDRVIIGHGVIAGGEAIDIKGHCPPLGMRRGLTYRLFGQNRTHHRYGKQFHFNSFVQDKPATVNSVTAYLCQCSGPTRGSITRRVAGALIEEFGTGAIDAVINRPAEAAAAVKGWSPEKAMLACEMLRSMETARDTKVELIGMLEGFRFPKKTVDAAIKTWGSRAATEIREDPYQLIPFRGCSFKRCDALFVSLAREKYPNNQDYMNALGCIRRQSLCAANGVKVRANVDGSTWIRLGEAKASVRNAISGTMAKPEEAVEKAIADGFLGIHFDHQVQPWVGTRSNVNHEAEIAQIAFEMQKEPGDLWPNVESFGRLTDHQREQLSVALSSRIGILQGSPGTGKTFSVGSIVRALVEKYGHSEVVIACPSGKAAVRVSESMRKFGVDLSATTIHQMLKVTRGAGAGAGDGWSFFHNENNPLEVSFVILDEQSMPDIDLMASALRAVDERTHVLMVGDSNQLPPIGHGKPFFDLQSCVPTGNLTELHRNAGRIVKACAEIRDKNTFTPSPSLDPETGENFPWLELKPDDQIPGVMRLIEELSLTTEVDPIWEVQVLCATNKTRRVLNKMLQEKLNSHGHSVQGNPFRIGDKIVCLKNGLCQSTDEFNPECDKQGNVYVANGDIGYVISLDVGRMRIGLDFPKREIVVPHSVVSDSHDDDDDDDSESRHRGAVGDWDLAYALTVHKYQGSECRMVIMLVESGGPAKMIQTKNLLFTGISRAQEITFGVGELQVARAACRRDGISNRKTFLSELFHRKVFAETFHVEDIWRD